MGIRLAWRHPLDAHGSWLVTPLGRLTGVPRSTDIDPAISCRVQGSDRCGFTEHDRCCHLTQLHRRYLVEFRLRLRLRLRCPAFLVFRLPPHEYRSGCPCRRGFASSSWGSVVVLVANGCRRFASLFDVCWDLPRRELCQLHGVTFGGLSEAPVMYGVVPQPH